jgi:siroheme decarboxylase
MINELDLRIINRMQYGFPICEYPFAEVASELGIKEAELIDRVEKLRDDRTLTRFGPMYHAEHLGGALSLAAMSIPEDEFDAVTEVVNKLPEIAHNYKRTHDLNMWFVIATEEPHQLDTVIQSIEEQTGYKVYNMPKKEEFYVGFYLDL